MNRETRYRKTMFGIKEAPMPETKEKREVLFADKTGTHRLIGADIPHSVGYLSICSRCSLFKREAPCPRDQNDHMLCGAGKSTYFEKVGKK